MSLSIYRYWMTNGHTFDSNMFCVKNILLMIIAFDRDLRRQMMHDTCKCGCRPTLVFSAIVNGPLNNVDSIIKQCQLRLPGHYVSYLYLFYFVTKRMLQELGILPRIVFLMILVFILNSNPHSRQEIYTKKRKSITLACKQRQEMLPNTNTFLTDWNFGLRYQSPSVKSVNWFFDFFIRLKRTKEIFPQNILQDSCKLRKCHITVLVRKTCMLWFHASDQKEDWRKFCITLSKIPVN